MFGQLEGSLRSVRLILASLLPIGMGSWFLWYSTFFAPSEFSGSGGEFNEAYRTFYFAGMFFLILGFCTLLRGISSGAKQLAPQFQQDRTQEQWGAADAKADAVIERYLAQKSAEPKSNPANTSAKKSQTDRPGFGKKRA